MSASVLRHVDCVRLYVPDLDAGLAFYRDRLGLTLAWRSDVAIGLKLPESTTEIVLHTEPQPPEVDFLVDSADEAARQIEAAGGAIVVAPFDIDVGRCAVVQDVWGNQFIVMDLSKGLYTTDADGNVTGLSQPGK